MDIKNKLRKRYLFKVNSIFCDLKKKKIDNKKKIKAVIWAFAHIALYLNPGNNIINDEIIKALFLDMKLNLILKQK
jgi:hypothetical protein